MWQKRFSGGRVPAIGPLPSASRRPEVRLQAGLVERLTRHGQTLYESGHPVALVGDFNVVPTDFDIYSPKNWRKNALLQPESRAAYERLLKQGWTDALNLTKGRLRAQIASTQAGGAGKELQLRVFVTLPLLSSAVLADGA